MSIFFHTPSARRNSQPCALRALGARLRRAPPRSEIIFGDFSFGDNYLRNALKTESTNSEIFSPKKKGMYSTTLDPWFSFAMLCNWFTLFVVKMVSLFTTGDSYRESLEPPRELESHTGNPCHCRFSISTQHAIGICVTGMTFS